MGNRKTLLPISLTQQKDLKTLVEHRTAYTLNDCELNIFETYQSSHLVPLTFSDPVITSMLRGKKIMHLFEDKSFDYLPGETVIVPAKETMHIDFPEADDINPTQCIALAIDTLRISKTLDYLNEHYPKQDTRGIWQLNYNDYRFDNDNDLSSHLNKMIAIAISPDKDKDILADLALQELIIRLAQQQQRKIARQENSHRYKNPLYYIAQFIRDHITDKFNIDDLSKMACMSKVTFYRNFKKEFGLSPVEYILHERIRVAKKLLSVQENSISEACYESGFMDPNYFHRQFKRTEGITPKQFRSLFLKDN